MPCAPLQGQTHACTQVHVNIEAWFEAPRVLWVNEMVAAGVISTSTTLLLSQADLLSHSSLR